MFDPPFKFTLTEIPQAKCVVWYIKNSLLLWTPPLSFNLDLPLAVVAVTAAAVIVQ